VNNLGHLGSLLVVHLSMSHWIAFVLDHDECFQASKSFFNGKETCHIDNEASSEVHTDASSNGFWRVVLEKCQTNLVHLSFLERTQSHWGSTDRELLAVKKCVRKLSLLSSVIINLLYNSFQEERDMDIFSLENEFDI